MLTQHKEQVNNLQAKIDHLEFKLEVTDEFRKQENMTKNDEICKSTSMHL